MGGQRDRQIERWANRSIRQTRQKDTIDRPTDKYNQINDSHIEMVD